MPKDRRATPTKPFSQPFQGLFLDRPAWTIDPRGFADCNNVRIALGKIDTTGLGYKNLVNGSMSSVAVRGMYEALTLAGGATIIIATKTDLLKLDGSNAAGYVTPTYTTGTATAGGGQTITGSGTSWNTSIGGGYRNNARQGDQISLGSSSQTSVGATWLDIVSVQSDTQLTIAQSIGAAGAQAYTIRQRFSSADANGTQQIFPWSFEIFPGAGSPDNGDMLVAVNGNPHDPVFKWNLTNGALVGAFVTGLPWNAACVRRYKNLLCYGGLIQPNGTNLPTSMANSDNGLPFSANTGVAGQYVVSDGAYGISDMEVLGNQLLMYMGGRLGGDVISGNFVGAPLLFVFTEIIRGRGPLAGRLVATFSDRHQFITTDGEYRYNGLFVQPMNTQVWRSIVQNIDYARINSAHYVISETAGDLYWAIPLTSDPGSGSQSAPIVSAYAEHYMEQANNYLFKPYTKRDWPFTAAFRIVANTSQIVAGDENGAAWSFSGNKAGAAFDNSGGSTITSSVTFPQRFVINERSRGLVKRVYPFVEQMAGGSPNLTVTLTMRDQVSGAVAVTDAQTFDPTYSTGVRFTTHYRRGRTGQVQVSGTSGWVLDGGDWDVVPGGER